MGLGALLGHLLVESRHNVVKNWKSNEWPQTHIEHLTVILVSTLQALKTYLWGWKFCSFCSTTTSFRDIRLTENRKCTEWPKTEHLTVKSTLYTLNNREVRIFVSFVLRSAVFNIQGRRKSQMHWKNPNWTWTFNSKNYPVYTKYFLQSPKFWSVSLYD